MTEIVATYRIDASDALSTLDEVDTKAQALNDKLRQPVQMGGGGGGGGGGAQQLKSDAEEADASLTKLFATAASGASQMVGLGSAESSAATALAGVASAAGPAALAIVGVGIAVETLKASVDVFQTMELGNARLAAAFDMSAESVQALKMTWEDVGQSGDAVNTVLQRLSMGLAQMQTQMDNGKEPTGKVADGLRQIGIDAVGADGSLKTVGDLMPEIMQAFGSVNQETGKFANGISAATIANDLFGRSGAQSVMALEQQGAAYTENLAKLQQYGDFSESNKEKAIGEAVATADLGAAMDHLGLEVGGAVVPALASLADLLVKVTQGMDAINSSSSQANQGTKDYKQAVDDASAAVDHFVLAHLSHDKALVDAANADLAAMNATAGSGNAAEKAAAQVAALSVAHVDSAKNALADAAAEDIYGSALLKHIGGNFTPETDPTGAIQQQKAMDQLQKDKEAESKASNQRVISDREAAAKATLDGKQAEADGYNKAIDLEIQGDAQGAKQAIAAGQARQQSNDRIVTDTEAMNRALAAGKTDEAAGYQKAIDDEIAGNAQIAKADIARGQDAQTAATAQISANDEVSKSAQSLAKDIQELSSVGKPTSLLDPEKTKADASAALAAVRDTTSQIAAAAAAGDTARVTSLTKTLGLQQTAYQDDLNLYKQADAEKTAADKAAQAASTDGIKQTQSAWSDSFSALNTLSAASARGVSESLTSAFSGATSTIQGIYTQIEGIDRELSDNTIAPDRRQDLENTKASLVASLGEWKTYSGQVVSLINEQTAAEHNLAVEQAKLSEQQAELASQKASQTAGTAVKDEGLTQQIANLQVMQDQWNMLLEPAKQYMDLLQSQRDVLADQLNIDQDILTATGQTSQTDQRLLQLQLQADQIRAGGGKVPADLQAAISAEQASLSVARDKMNLQEAGNRQQDASLKLSQDQTKQSVDQATAQEKATLNIGGQLTSLQQTAKLHADINAAASVHADVEGKVLAAEQAQLQVLSSIAALKKAEATPFQGGGAGGPNTIGVPGSMPDPNAVKQQAVPVGNAISQGIAQGIDEQAEVIADHARVAIENAIMASKKQAGISSPSTRARDEIGLMLAQGVAEGLTAGAGAVAGAMGSLTGIPQLTAGIAAPMFSGPTPIAMSSAAGGQGGSVSSGDFNVHINNPVVRSNADLDSLQQHLSQLHGAAQAQRRRGLGWPNNFSDKPQI